MPSQPSIDIRPADITDLNNLNALEQASFDSDRLSKRRLKHWIQADNGIFLVATQQQSLLGYCLVLLHNGTRLARLYSIAISQSAQGQGVGKLLLEKAEQCSADKGRLYMRLEVAVDNIPAIGLYKKLGYTAFGTYNDYYEDHRDALRMQKRIKYLPSNLISQPVPWYNQTTDFTCGPASLMMAMAGLNDFTPNQESELAIWREATTIFMTSGHGGCHPIGLALSAHKRGYQVETFINQDNPLFLESVRDTTKKQIMSVVHEQFVEEAKKENIPIRFKDIDQTTVEKAIKHGALVPILISTYRMDKRKAPHWVVITATDDECFYVHDPDPTEHEQTALDCQYLPISRQDFDKMSMFGSSRLRTAIIIRKKK